MSVPAECEELQLKLMKLLNEKKKNVTTNNRLQESNEKVDEVKEDLVKEVESHKVSRKTIDELLVKTQGADQRLKKYSATIRVLLREENSKKTVQQ